jgi:phosphotransacetylase
VASPFAVRDKMRGPGIHAAGLRWWTINSPSLLQKNMEAYMALRQRKTNRCRSKEARESMNLPLASSAMMVRRGDVEVGVAGNLSSTAAVLRAGLSVLPKSPASTP